LDSGRLRKIIFQSEASLKVHSEFMTQRISDASTFVTLVPPEINRKENRNDSGNIKVLLIISRSYLKGTFLLPRILASAPDNINFTVVCSEPVGIPELENDPRINEIITPRLPIPMKKQLFQSHDLFLNISQMDTLGSFLDSVRFNTPMLTVPGSHAQSYVKHGETGWVLPSPYYFYDPQCGEAYKNKDEFASYLEAKDLNEWDPLFEAMSFYLNNLSSNEIHRVTKNQYKDSIERLTVDRWLADVGHVYDEAQA
jgi:hypothetical protein